MNAEDLAKLATRLDSAADIHAIVAKHSGLASPRSDAYCEGYCERLARLDAEHPKCGCGCEDDADEEDGRTDAADREPADYFRTVNGSPVPFIGEPGSGTPVGGHPSLVKAIKRSPNTPRGPHSKTSAEKALKAEGAPRWGGRSDPEHVTRTGHLNEHMMIKHSVHTGTKEETHKLTWKTKPSENNGQEWSSKTFPSLAKAVHHANQVHESSARAYAEGN